MQNLITLTAAGLATMLSIGLGLLLESALMALVFWGMRDAASKYAPEARGPVSVQSLTALSTAAKPH